MTDINTPTGWDERLNSIAEQIFEFSEKEQSVKEQLNELSEKRQSIREQLNELSEREQYELCVVLRQKYKEIMIEKKA